MSRKPVLLTLGILLVMVEPAAAATEGHAEQGSQAFRICLACHSLEPGEHRTGPSLAGIVGRRAGTVAGFSRYSPALKAARITWTEETLDDWLLDPQAVIPGNRMIFRGIEDQTTRADLIAYLEQAAAAGGAAAPGQPPGGMMGAADMADLKREVGPNNRIASISYCADTYTVAVEAGEAHQFWEFNLRFKTDSSARGPEPGHPVLIPGGMMGDRAFVVFADPLEISRFIQKNC